MDREGAAELVDLKALLDDMCRAPLPIQKPTISGVADCALGHVQKYKKVVHLIEGYAKHHADIRHRSAVICVIDSLCTKAKRTLKEKDIFTPRFGLRILETCMGVTALEGRSEKALMDRIFSEWRKRGWFDVPSLAELTERKKHGGGGSISSSQSRAHSASSSTGPSSGYSPPPEAGGMPSPLHEEEDGQFSNGDGDNDSLRSPPPSPPASYSPPGSVASSYCPPPAAGGAAGRAPTDPRSRREAAVDPRKRPRGPSTAVPPSPSTGAAVGGGGGGGGSSSADDSRKRSTPLDPRAAKRLLQQQKEKQQQLTQQQQPQQFPLTSPPSTAPARQHPLLGGGEEDEEEEDEELSLEAVGGKRFAGGPVPSPTSFRPTQPPPALAPPPSRAPPPLPPTPPPPAPTSFFAGNKHLAPPPASLANIVGLPAESCAPPQASTQKARDLLDKFFQGSRAGHIPTWPEGLPTAPRLPPLSESSHMPWLAVPSAEEAQPATLMSAIPGLFLEHQRKAVVVGSGGGGGGGASPSAAGAASQHGGAGGGKEKVTSEQAVARRWGKRNK